MKILRSLLLIVWLGLVPHTVFGADQIKTTESLITESNTVVNSAQAYPVTFYIGDNIAGITNALKSSHFTTSGVYTGNGTITFNIDGNGSKQYTLPNVGLTPTPFEIEYQDVSGTINPTSAGSYSYTLNFSPSGVEIYGLGIKMTETHRYAPPACADGNPANQKIKTTESLITESNTVVNSPQAYPVTFYIGDNIAGITNALKSSHFTASGVYTGNGTITFNIDGNGSKQFILPNVGLTPTPFEIEYQDASGTINPTSAGSYSYTLNFSPSGVEIYGLGIKMTETHRYAPPACAGMPIYGDIISAVFDSTGVVGLVAGYNSILWKGVLGGAGLNEGKVLFQFATANDTAGPWNYIGGATCASDNWFDPGAINVVSANVPVELKGEGINAATCVNAWNNKRYFRYKMRICSHDCITAGTFTPTVDDVVVNWAP